MKINKLLNFQLILSVICLTLLILTNFIVPLDWKLDIFLFAVLLLSLANNFINQPKIHRLINAVFILALPFTFRYIAAFTLDFIGDRNLIPTAVLYIIICLISLTINIPLVLSKFSNINNWFLKILAIDMVQLSYDLVVFYISDSTTLNFTLRYRLIDILAFLIITALLVKSWDISFIWKPKMNLSQIILLIVTLIFSIWYIFFANFSVNAQTYSEVWYNWHTMLSQLQFNYTAIFLALTPAILEEIERYFDIIILGKAFAKSKWRILITILGSALIYGLAHYSNLIGHWNQLSAVNWQVLYTFGTGILFGCLCLYTGNVWLTILLHLGLDTLGYAIQSTPLLRIPGILPASQVYLLIATIPILITLLLLLFKPVRNLIKQNLEIMAH